MASELALLDSLSKYELKLGIFTAEGIQTVPVSVEADDGTVSAIRMKIADVMYFTEYGTISIPGRRVLDRCLPRASLLLEDCLSKIVDEIFSGKATERSIEASLKACALKIESESRAIFSALAKEINVLGSLLENSDDSNKYIFNPGELSKYIRCSVSPRH